MYRFLNLISLYIAAFTFTIGGCLYYVADTVELLDGCLEYIAERMN